jgi:RNA polymerase sigma-70 factor (ECF subfamily)
MDYPKIPDTELLELMHGGDQAAFNAIYDRHCPPLYRTALRILEDEEAAKDVVQEVFISLYERVKRVRFTVQDSKFKVHPEELGAKSEAGAILNLQAYLFQTAKYQCFMHLRAGRISEKHLNRMNAVMVSNEVEEQLHAQELQQLVDRSLANLPEKCREVFYLSRFESLSNKKIAERLNISHKTVENQITKALKMLHLSVDKLVAIALFTAIYLFHVKA